MIYLDSAATYPVLPCAREAFASAPFGNPSSEHEAGRAARAALEDARARIARCVGADADEVYFTSGATEACNWAVDALNQATGYVMASQLEHHAVSEPVLTLEGVGWGTVMGRKKGSTAWIQMLANNETGEIFNMLERQTDGDLIFTDATAAVGHIPVDFHALDADYMAFGSQKFGGIPGIGVLVKKHGAPLYPMIEGGGQERGMRAGTESVALARAMAAALEWQCELIAATQIKLASLKGLLKQKLSEIGGVLFNEAPNRPHMPHILNVSFDGVDGHALAHLLSERHGVMVSAGAACASGAQKPSHVLMAMYGDPLRAAHAIRISLSHENTMEECEKAADAIAECVEILRSVS